MKRLFFIGIAISFLGLSSFALEKNLPDSLKSFYKTFQNAQNVNWTEVDDMVRIGFTLNGHQQFAYYSNDELIVVATEITTGELPGEFKNQLEGYKGFVVSNVYMMNQDGMKEFCVVIDSPSKHIILKGKKKLIVYLEEKK